MYLSVEYGNTRLPPPQLLRVVEESCRHTLMTIEVSGRPAPQLQSGVPLQVSWGASIPTARQTVGYVNHVDVREDDAFRIVAVGATYPLKDAVQREWKNVTLTKVVKDVAGSHYLRVYVEDDGYVYSSVTQSGQESDWALLVRLTEEAGLMLVSYNTHLYVVSAETQLMKHYHGAVLLGKTATTSTRKVIKADAHVGDALTTVRANVGSYGASGTQRVYRKHQVGAQFNRTLPEGTRDGKTLRYLLAREARKQHLHYRAEATISGTSSLYPSRNVLFSEYSSQLNGYWTVTKAEHVLTKRTFTTELSLGRGVPLGQGTSARTPGIRRPSAKTPPTDRLIHNTWRAS